MVQNDPRTKDNTTINEKKEKISVFSYFWSFLDHFGESGVEKNSKIFCTGIDFEWYETGC